MGLTMRLPLRTLVAAAAAAAFLAAAPAARAQAPGIPAAPPASPKGPPGGVVELDSRGDGFIDFRISYDANGQIAEEDLDFNHKGRMDTFYYYKAGVLQRVEIDTKDTGKVDLWVYLVDGSYVQRYEQDTDGDGKPDKVRSF